MTRASRGSVLYLTRAAPLPLVTGDRIRAFHVLDQLVRHGWHVSLFSLETGPENDASRSQLSRLCIDTTFHRFETRRLARLFRVTRNIATRRPFQLDYYYDRGVEAALEPAFARDFDLVLAAQLYTYAYIPTELRARTVLDSHNAEARRLESMTVSGSGVRRIMAKRQLDPVRRLEAEAANAVLRVLAVSPEDQTYFAHVSRTPVELVPNGVDTSVFRPRQSVPANRVFLFLGSFDYSANVDAALYLLREIGPRTRAADIHFMLVGIDPPRLLRRAAERASRPTNVTGFVPSAAPVVQAARALVVPLRHGGGTRLKILEALALGVPVVSTSIGCEGLGLVHERDVLVADTAAEFAFWIDRVSVDDNLCSHLAANGRATITARFDWSEIGGRLDLVMRQALDGVRSRAGGAAVRAGTPG